MRWPFVCVASLWATAVPAFAEPLPPLVAPPSGMRDDFAAIVSDRLRPREYMAIVPHHDAWGLAEDKPISQHAAKYLSSDGLVDFHIGRVGDEVVGVALTRDRSELLDHEPHETAEQMRRRRRPLEPGDVPSDLLSLSRWLRAPAASADVGASADYEIVLQVDYTPPGMAPAIRTMRRHGDWLYIEEMAGGIRRNLKITSQSARFSMHFFAEYYSSLESLLLHRLPAEPTQLPASMVPKDLNRSEQILGETCEWFDVEPGVTDGGLEECRTPDGILLKSNAWGWGSQQIFTAVRLSRRPVRLQEVMPPAALLDPKSWGLD